MRAENCTPETRHRFRVWLSSDSAFRGLLDPPLPIVLHGELALPLGGLRASDVDLNVPVVIRSGDLHFEPIVVPGIGCLCVRGVPYSAFGPGNLGGGLIGCGPSLVRVAWASTHTCWKTAHRPDRRWPSTAPARGDQPDSR